MAGNPNSEYNIYDLGFSKDLIRGKIEDPDIEAPEDTVSQDPLSGSSSFGSSASESDFSGGLYNPIAGLTPPASIAAGELPALIGFAKKKFTDTIDGFLQGVDTDGVYKWIIGNSTSSADWSVTTPGTFTVKGILAGTTLIGGSIHIPDQDTTANSWHVDTTGLMWSGATSTNKATAPVRLNPTGEMTLGSPSSTHLQLSGPNVYIQSSDYSAGVSGFRLSTALVEAENLVARGIMKGATFQYDVVSAVGGQVVVSNSDVLEEDMTALDSANLRTKGTTSWTANDILLIRATTGSGIQQEYLRVTSTTAFSTVSYSEANQDDFTTLRAGAFVEDGEMFQAPAGGSVDTCKFYLRKLGAPAGNAVAKLYLSSKQDGTAGIPSGAALATSDNFNVATLGAAFALVTFTFSTPYTVTNGVYYIIVVAYSGGDFANNIRVGEDGSAPSYIGTFAVLDSTDNTWYNIDNWPFGDYDVVFYVYITLPSTLTVTRDLAASFAANSNPTWQKGTVVVKQGSSDGAAAFSGGYLRLLGEGTNAPHYSVFQRSGVAYNAVTEVVRLGQLNGIGSFVADTFGIYIGDTSTGNFLTYDTLSGNLIVNDSIISNQDIYGDASDGNVTIAADTTMTTDMYADTLTINAGKILTTGGFRVFAQILAGSGEISCVGNAGGDGVDATEGGGVAAGGTAGAALVTGSLFGSHAGKAGGNGGEGGIPVINNQAVAGTAGTNTDKSLGSAGVGGGGGNNAGSVSQGTGAGGGGSGGTITGTILNSVKNASFALLMADVQGGLSVFKPSPGAGSGGGGGAGRNANNNAASNGGGGGGSGSSGGLMTVFARKITFSGSFTVKGGNGGAGGDGSPSTGIGGNNRYGGGGGGGGGGNGGALVIVYSSSTAAFTTNITGGALGAAGLDGNGLAATAGTVGSVGRLITLQV